jgi:hypothetical protein
VKYIIRMTALSGAVMYLAESNLAPAIHPPYYWIHNWRMALLLDKRQADAEFCEISIWAIAPSWELEVLTVD